MGDQNNMNPYICRICGITCTGPETYHQHLTGSKHLKKELQSKMYGSLPEQSAIPAAQLSLQTSSYSCQVCQTVMSGPEAFFAHMNGKPHAKKLRQQNLLREMNAGSTSTTDEMKPTAPIELARTNTYPAKEIMTSLLQSKSIDSRGIYYCHLCQVPLSGPESAESHYAGAQHSKRQKQELLLCSPQLIALNQSMGKMSLDDKPNNLCKEIPTDANATESMRDVYNQQEKDIIKDKDED